MPQVGTSWITMKIEHSPNKSSAFPATAVAGLHGICVNLGETPAPKGVSILSGAQSGRIPLGQGARPEKARQEGDLESYTIERRITQSEREELRGEARRKLIRLLVDKIVNDDLPTGGTTASNVEGLNP
jgi:hypothetical protein